VANCSNEYGKRAAQNTAVPHQMKKLYMCEENMKNNQINHTSANVAIKALLQNGQN
jgi:hypothetical protein